MSNVVPLRTHGGFMHSGGELPHGCSDVWAMAITFGTGKLPTGTGHFFVRKAKGYVALCGYTSPLRMPNGQCALFGVGTYPRCKRCMDYLRRAQVEV